MSMSLLGMGAFEIAPRGVPAVAGNPFNSGIYEGHTRAYRPSQGLYSHDGVLVPQASALNCARNSAGYAQASNLIWTAFAVDELRISDRGLLSETAVQNYIRYSRSFDDPPWSLQTGIALNDGAAESVFAGETAVVYENSGVTDGFIVQQNAFSGPVTPCHLTMWVKLLSGTLGTDDAKLNIYGGGLASAEVISVGDVITSDWSRIAISGVTDGSPGNVTANFRTEVACEIAVDNVQMVFGDHFTSEIVTGASAQTRVADVITDIKSEIGSEKQILVKFRGPPVYAGVKEVVSLDDETANERVRIYVDASEDCIAEVIDGGSTVAQINLGAVTEGQTHTVAMQFETNDVEAAMDGSAGTPDTSATMPTWDTIHVGCDYQGANQLNEYIYELLTWDETTGTVAELSA